MDLKQSKPVHLRCPKCGNDFSVNSNRVEEDFQIARCKVAALKAEMERAKQKHGKKSADYKRLYERYTDAVAQLVAIKKVRAALNKNMELQKYGIFVALVKSKIGSDETIKLLKEAEDMMVYNDYDNAVQRSNRFGGV